VTSLRIVNLLEAEKSVFVFAKASQSIPATTHGAHEMQAEAVDVRLSTSRELRELGMAADAYPHGARIHLEAA